MRATASASASKAASSYERWREGPEGGRTNGKPCHGPSPAPGGGPPAGCGRTVTGSGNRSAALSGPTSGPSSPSQGMSGMAIARPRMRSRGTRPISAVAAVVGIGVVGEQVVMSGRDEARRDGVQRPPVERVALGPPPTLPVQEYRPVFADRDPHPRHAAHRLEIRNRRAQGFRGIEQHPIADFRGPRRTAERRHTPRLRPTSWR